ncbi:MAG: DUF4293 domain-containing protein [Prevotellaceae bacterium]|jgi:hypothetical protein|nr:DUF4293 domain-containing protein [Prevotellaceae bacterium]
MIQRIQTLFLLLAAVAAGASLCGHWTNIAPECNALLAFGTNWASSIFIAATVLLIFATIFFYKKRKIQLNLCIVDIILIVGFYICYAVEYFRLTKLIAENQSLTPSFFVFTPLIALVFIVLAMKNIKKDENLIRSLDRLR